MMQNEEDLDMISARDSPARTTRSPL
jgi:hypothetical protein